MADTTLNISSNQSKDILQPIDLAETSQMQNIENSQIAHDQMEQDNDDQLLDNFVTNFFTNTINLKSDSQENPNVELITVPKSALEQPSHLSPPDERYVCKYPDCDKMYKHKSSLSTHQHRKHPPIQLKYRCKWPNCRLVFGYLSQAQNHVRNIHFKRQAFNVVPNGGFSQSYLIDLVETIISQPSAQNRSKTNRGT